MPVDKIIENQPLTDVEISDETLAESGFHWRGRDGVHVLVCTMLDTLGFTNGFSTRLGGVSPFPANSLNLAGFHEDSSDNIYENRRRFLAALGYDCELATAWQVHGDTVKIAASADDAAASEDRADAIVSDLEGILVGVKTADCVPVLLADPTTGAYAAVHAGWRGTVQSIASKAVRAMKEHYGTQPADLVSAIGPGAGRMRYEVGPEVVSAFAETFSVSEAFFTPTRDGHALIDLRSANHRQLLDCGLRAENIYSAPFCTMGRTDLFFSYRIEKNKYGKTGRLLSVIGRP